MESIINILEKQSHSLLHLGNVATKFTHSPPEQKTRYPDCIYAIFRFSHLMPFCRHSRSSCTSLRCPVKSLTSIKRVTLLAAESNRQCGVAEKKQIVFPPSVGNK